MPEEAAVVLVSGGMDSLVATAVAHDRGARLHLLHVDYGQRTRARERRSFGEIADFYGVPEGRRKSVEAGFLREIGGSSLTDAAIPVARHRPGASGVPASYVPFRNTILVALAVAWAETIPAGSVYVGAVAEDSPGYPDCRPSYYEAYARLVREGTRRGDIRLETPVIAMRKAEIVRAALDLGAPLASTWSCYADGDLACGECDSCALRLRGFREAGAADPIPYRKGPAAPPGQKTTFR